MARKKVYVSSTFKDLEEHRSAVKATLERAAFDVECMEKYPAFDERPKDKCLADVAECDYYVLILAWRYGFQPEDDNPRTKDLSPIFGSSGQFVGGCEPVRAWVPVDLWITSLLPTGPTGQAGDLWTTSLLPTDPQPYRKCDDRTARGAGRFGLGEHPAPISGKMAVCTNHRYPEGGERPHKISIAEARTLPLGTVVTVAGSVTTPSGAFESSFFDKGFALQDHTAGIYVSLSTDLGVAPRRRAQVTGTLQDSFGLRILVPADPDEVRLTGTGPPIQPKFLQTSAIGEATEGLLVKVVGTITQAPVDDLPFGFIFFVDDGSGEVQIFVNVQTGIDVSGFSVGQLVSRDSHCPCLLAEYDSPHATGTSPATEHPAPRQRLGKDRSQASGDPGENRGASRKVHPCPSRGHRGQYGKEYAAKDIPALPTQPTRRSPRRTRPASMAIAMAAGMDAETTLPSSR